MVRACMRGADSLGRRRRVAQAHGEVAEPPLVADAADGRTLQALVELGLGPGEELPQPGAGGAVARLEGPLGARLGESVPRADGLAVVAAVDAIADEGRQLHRNRALVLD